MAKKSSFLGKTTRQLLDIDEEVFNSLKRKDLAPIVTVLASTANKRIKEMKKRRKKGPAMRRLKKSGVEHFSVKGKTLNEVRREFARVKAFLKDETSTVTGYKSFIKSAVTKLRRNGIEITEENYERFTDLFDDLKDADASVSGRSLRYSALKELAEMVETTDYDNEEVLNKMLERVVELYESQQERTEISEFFALS